MEGSDKIESTKVTFNLSKHDDFSEWYEQIVKKAELCDNRYPLKGMVAWMPYGYKALKLVMKKIECLLDETGHEEVSMPSLVPASIFQKEKDFLKGFSGEAYVITNVNEKPLEEKLYIRPTSETVMYEVVRQWINAVSDLPLKLYQTVNVFRYETKQTKPMLRVREIVKFNEAHTFHATEESAEQQIKEARQIYRKFFDFFMLPYIELRTPSWDTFPGAKYNYDFITVLPDGKGLELGSVINLGDKFAKVYNLQYNENNEYKYVQQTCYGVSERTLGAIVAMHGDDNGLIFPSQIAPIQIVIVPILKKGDEDRIINKAEDIAAKLKGNGYRVLVDNSDKGAGDKFYYWEAKGIPARIEVGVREADSSIITLFERATRHKIKVEESKLNEKIQEIYKSSDEELKNRANVFFKKNMHNFSNAEEAVEYINKADILGLVSLPWCGEEKCGRALEERLATPIIGYDDMHESKGICAKCGKASKYNLYFGRTY
ncbi:MAG: proline--tRNA ligase [Candidatus Micrarchaeaceae archaeon]